MYISIYISIYIYIYSNNFICQCMYHIIFITLRWLGNSVRGSERLPLLTGEDVGNMDTLSIKKWIDVNGLIEHD